MFKQIITSGIIGAGLFFAAPGMAHNSHGHHNHNYQTITPITHPAPRPAHRCVSGHKIDQRQANQKRRIRKGIRNGQLVGWEIAQVKKQQRQIRTAEKRMRKSGHCLTKKEANKLLKRLNRAGSKIRNLKRNGIRWGHTQRRNHSRMH